MRKKRSGKLLFLALAAGVALCCLIYFFPPTVTFPVASIQLSIVLLFLLLTAVFSYALVSFLTRRKKHGFLVSLFVVTYLIFRLNNLTHPFFLILLVALLLTLELVFQGRAEVYTPHTRKHSLKSDPQKTD